MHYNRPYYASPISIVIDHNEEHAFFLFNALFSWFSQIYSQEKDTKPIHVIVYCNDSNYFTIVKEACDRYKKSLSFNQLGKEFDCSYIIKDKSLESHLREMVEELNKDIVLITSSKNLPSPYFLEIVSNAIEENRIVSCNNSYAFDTKTMRTKGYLDKLETDQNITIDPKYNPIQTADYHKNPRCAVLIPCMDRWENLKETLPQWISQLYQNKQIVIIDYSSENKIEHKVKEICQTFKCSCVTDDDYTYDANVVVFRVADMCHFNISHAYNYAINRIKTDVICTVCADSCPRNYYLDLVMSLIDDNSLLQAHWGLHTITYNNWKKLNGHQEFIVGWGAEDDDFRIRAQLMGLSVKILSSDFVFQIPQIARHKGNLRQISDINISSTINSSRFNEYIARYGFEGNYKKPIGGKSPIEMHFLTNSNHIACCQYKKHNNNFPECVKYNDKINVFYVLVKDGDKDPSWLSYNYWSNFGEIKHQADCHVYSYDDIEIENCLTKFASFCDRLE